MIKLIKLIKELIFPSRSTEPTVIRNLRIIFLGLLYAGVVIYFCWKVYKLHEDERSLSFEQDTNSSIPAPTVIFLSLYNFTVKCEKFYNNITTGDCTNYVKVDNTYQDANIYALTFNASGLVFADPNNANNSTAILQEIDMDIQITDPNYPGGDAFLQVLFLDQETVPDIQVASQTSRIKGFSNFKSTAVASNLYYLANNQSYFLLYERKKINLLKQSVVNVLSGNANHDPVALLSSKLVSYPNLDNPSYASIFIQPSSYIVITETEDSVLTVSDLFSAVGGIHGAAMAIYAFFFGNAAISYVQRLLPCVRHKLGPASTTV